MSGVDQIVFLIERSIDGDVSYWTKETFSAAIGDAYCYLTAQEASEDVFDVLHGNGRIVAHLVSTLPPLPT